MSTPAQTPTDRRQIHGVVLAAGRSSRAGFPKALAGWGSASQRETLVTRAVSRLQLAGVAAISVVVAAPHETLIRAELMQAGQASAAAPQAALRCVRCVTNQTPALGMLSSLQTALQDPWTAAADAVVVSLVDHPGVSVATIEALIAAWQEDPAPLVRLSYQGRGGHPFLLAGDALRSALNLPPTATVRDLQALASRRLQVETDDPHVLQDLDTAQLLEAAGVKRAP